jgi:hypothetical protein
MKFPEMKIGDAAFSGKPVPPVSVAPPPAPAPTLPPLKISGKIPVPPRIQPRPTFPGKY